MDIMFEVINRTPQEVEGYIQAIKNSNMAKPLSFEIIDVLESVLNQIKHSTEMGWL